MKEEEKRKDNGSGDRMMAEERDEGSTKSERKEKREDVGRSRSLREYGPH